MTSRTDDERTASQKSSLKTCSGQNLTFYKSKKYNYLNNVAICINNLDRIIANS